MQFRTFGRTGWQVSEIGYGMWGMGGWTGSDDEESLQRARSRRRARLQLLRHRVGVRQRQERDSCSARRCARTADAPSSYVATKIPPKNMKWPGKRGVPRRRHVSGRPHPRVHREEPRRTSASTPSTCSSSTSGATPGRTTTGWQRAVDDLKREKLVRAVGISVNRWEPTNVLRALDTGLDRQRAGRLQHLRPGARRRAVPLLPGARHRRHRARAVRRRQPDRAR